MRILPLLLLSAGCALSPAENQQLASYQRNAKYYFESGKLDQAQGMIDRGLEIAPRDYTLRSMQAAVQLRRSGAPSLSEDPALQASLAQFAELYTERSPRKHAPHVLLGYALARQKLGMRHVSEASRIEARMQRGDAMPAEFKAMQERANVEFRAATEMLQVLIDRGEMTRVAHFHMMQLAAGLHQGTVIEHGEKYLEAARREQDTVRAELQRTTVAEYEAKLKGDLRQLQAEEIDVRTFLAARLYDSKQYGQALVHLDAVLQLDPSRTADLYNRGELLRLLGRNEEAKDDLRKFLATTTLPPDNPKVVDAVQALRR